MAKLKSLRSISAGTWITALTAISSWLALTTWTFARQYGITIKHGHTGYFLKDEWGHKSTEYLALTPRILPLKPTTKRAFILKQRLLLIFAERKASSTPSYRSRPK